MMECGGDGVCGCGWSVWVMECGIWGLVCVMEYVMGVGEGVCILECGWWCVMEFVGDGQWVMGFGLDSWVG